MKGLLLLSLQLATCTLGLQAQHQVYLPEELENEALFPVPPSSPEDRQYLKSGLQTSEDAEFYALSTRFKPFSNENETLVGSFSVKHKQGVDCGSRHVKLFPDTLNQEEMRSEPEYYILFHKPSNSSPCQPQRS